MGTLIQDLVYAWRTLRRSPGFAIVAISRSGSASAPRPRSSPIVNGVLLRPLPSAASPSGSRNLWVDFGVGAQSLPAMSPGDFRDYQQRSRSFEMLAAGSGPQVDRRHRRADRPRRRAGTRRRLAHHRELPAAARRRSDLRPSLHGGGRSDRRTEGRDPELRAVAAPLRRRSVARRPHASRLDGLDQTVVGIMPRGFRLWLPSEAFLITDSQIWKPLQFDYANQPPRNFTLFTVFGAAEAGRHLRAGAGGDGGHREQLRAEHTGARGRRHARPRRAAPGRRGQARAARRSWRCSWRSVSCC